MIPPRPCDAATATERQVFELLHRIASGPEDIALSSLNLAEHEYKRWGEVDFVLVMSTGLLVVEVKGGTVTASDGIWKYEGRWGPPIERSESPIAQVQSAYSSLMKNYLEPVLGKKVLANVPTGFCVLMPRTGLGGARRFMGGPEMPAELVATKEDCTGATSLRAFLERVSGYWRKQMRAAPIGWSPAEMRKVVATLRPSFDRVPPLSIFLARVRDEQLELTTEQYRFLDYLEGAPRVLAIGGAGCGKTFLAAECLRREMPGNPVLITGTKTLAAHLRASNIADSGRVFSFDEVASSPSPTRGKYSTLIVDEGQQITSEAAFKVLGRLLDHELADARWRWFSDPNHQVGITSSYNAGAQAKLESWATVAPSLRENCRNTAQIIRAVEFATGAMVGTAKVKGSGPEVRYAQAETVSGMVEEAAVQIREWIADGEVRPGHMVLLTPLPLNDPDSQVPAISAAAGIGYRAWEAGWDQRSPYPNVLGVSTIEDFRGLEAPFIILCDLGGAIDQLARDLYLGMTRANFCVFVLCDQAARARLIMARTGVDVR